MLYIVGERAISTSIRERRQHQHAQNKAQQDPTFRYKAIRKVGKLVHAQTLDEYNIVISEIYEYGGSYYLFVVSPIFKTVAWWDIEEPDILTTIREYQQMRVRNHHERILHFPWLTRRAHDRDNPQSRHSPRE